MNPKDPSKAKQLKQRLQGLINSSITFNSFPKKTQKMWEGIMLSADPDTMKEFIEALGEEAASVSEFEKETKGDMAEIEGLIKEANQLEKNIKSDMLAIEEEEDRGKDIKKADVLLKKLEKIHKKK